MSRAGRLPDAVFPPTKITYVGERPVALQLRRVQLSVRDAGGPPRELSFSQSVITAGSLEGNDVVLADPTVSRYHCKIVEEDQSYSLVDLGSTNGTCVNKVRVREAYLTPGAVIHLGKSEIRFHPIEEKLEIEPSPADRFGGLIGRDVKMREIFGILEKIAPSGVTVVIEGETGTGKEVVARAIHDASGRRQGPFMVIDCGAVPTSLIESELFGHERGSFTGAIMTRQGLFEMAHGGTVFLDEVGELSLDLQPKLLRVLEQREIKRVGGTKAIPIDVRVLAATNRNLEREVRDGRFREDLFYRLSVVRIFLPPLRERREDIPLLVKHFLKNHALNRDGEGRPKVTKVDRAALDAMKLYDWPGNVRELLNVLSRAVSFNEEGRLTVEDVPPHLRGESEDARADTSLPFKEAKERWVSSFERDYLVALLRKHSRNISHAAREAGIDRKYFRKLMRKYRITAAELE
jgi:transcriptional regulator with GAF, ATPase, and Fis domain